ncbi:MAG TPA: DUF952 domain-containing protein [Acidimicrobiales bacterium]|nr:DUF952 domain-containing protein [Acidimicrobiales bacterium]
MTRIFHLVGAGGGSPPLDDIGVEQLEQHGYVHCCFREQLAEVATWWFDPGTELVALEVDTGRLSGERVEPSPRRWYPHVYGLLDAGAVAGRHPVPRTVDGVAGLPGALRRPPPAYRVTGHRGGAPATVRWQAGALDGDPSWVQDALEAVHEARLVELAGPGGPYGPATVVSPASLDTPYASFCLLAGVSDGITAYEGDGFGESA